MTSTPVRPSTEAGRPAPPTRGTAVFGAMLVVVGLAWLVDLLGWVEFDAGLVLPGLLAFIGVALIVGSWDGEHSGLVVLGVIVAILTVLAAVTPFDTLNAGVGDREHRPRAAAELAPEYTLGIGQLELDLTRLAGLDLGRQRVEIRVGAGDAHITVPEGMGIAIDASVGAGDVILFGTKWSGVDVDRSYRSPGYGEATDAILLDIEVMTGQVEVTR